MSGSALQDSANKSNTGKNNASQTSRSQNRDSHSDAHLERFDVVVVGAGMAGLALAAALAPSGKSIAVLDNAFPEPPEQFASGFDLRVSALTHASENFLRHLGAWDHMANLLVAPYQHMQVWDGDGTGNIAFHADEAGVTHLGHLVENRVTTWALWQTLQQYFNVTFIGEGLHQLDTAGHQPSLTLTSGRTLAATLIVGADGARSRVREQSGLSIRTWPYQQKAIVTTLRCERPHQNTAWQVFTPSGPLALLPLREHNTQGDSHICSIVWSQDDAHADHLLALSEADFCAALAQTFEHRLGTVTLLDRRVAFPLRQQHAKSYVTPGVALIGDAAHTIHPLAGQGINLGFMDAATLAEVLMDGLAQGLPLDEYSLLRRYQRRRQTPNLTMMAAMETFKRMYGPSVWALHLLRNWGMSQVDKHTLVKQQVVERALGLAGDLPRMARAELRVTL